MDKGALEVERLSLREFCEGNQEAGLLYWGSRRIFKIKLFKLASASIGPPLLGKMKCRSFPSACEKKDKFLYLGEFLC
jgi:hypothetical protein